MYRDHDQSHINELVEELRSLLASKTYDYPFINKLSDDSGLAKSTIQNLASGKTKRPAITTIGALNQALGYRLVRVPIGAVITIDNAQVYSRKTNKETVHYAGSA